MKALKISGCVVLILLVIAYGVGCSKVEPILLKTGQRLVEITADDQIRFTEKHKISPYKYIGKTYENYVDLYYYGNYQFLHRSMNIYDGQGGELSGEETEIYKTSTIVSFDKRQIKNSQIYVRVPGEINFVLSSDEDLQFEVLEAGLLHIISWQNESSAHLVFTPVSSIQDNTKFEGNYILYDYTQYIQNAYTETIAINLVDYQNKHVSMRLRDYIESGDFENYEEIARLYNFQWIGTTEAIYDKQLKKSKNSILSVLGNMGSDLYLRVPEDILMVSKDLQYQYIDKNTIWIKEGQVVLVFD